MIDLGVFLCYDSACGNRRKFRPDLVGWFNQAPVVQWIEHQPSKLATQVRFLAGA